MSFYINLAVRHVYNPSSKWKKAGEFFPVNNIDGSKRWPWLTREVHDWESPNGVEFEWDEKIFGDYPDSQKNFLEDGKVTRRKKESESESESESRSYVDADKNSETEVVQELSSQMEVGQEAEERVGEEKTKGDEEGKVSAKGKGKTSSK